jgi:hypothetical protein
MMATAPSEVSVLALTNAKGDELWFWIDWANQDARKRVILKMGKVNVLSQTQAGPALWFGPHLSL